MEVNDKECTQALVEIIRGLDDLQPKIKGLGVCVLAEFGRFLIYNLLVDGNCDDEDEDEEEVMSDGETGQSVQIVKFMGYKQMMIILQSEAVETGKSFISELLARIFHGKKAGIHGILSFDSAKSLIGKAEPVIIDDYVNDDLGCVLLSRASKAVWAKSKITIKKQTIVPAANILLCTNESIRNLKVEGRNKSEIYQKLSVIDLGEEPMGRSISGNKGEKFKEMIELTKVIRRFLPSYYGLMLQVCGTFITSDEFKEYQDITKHERLANILKNVDKLYKKLNQFCDLENIAKPESLNSELDTFCLTNKSQLTHTYKKPEYIVELIMSNAFKVVVTEHKSKEGIAFDFRSLTKFPWFEESFNFEANDGGKVFKKMRTRQLYLGKAEIIAAFLSFEFLSSGCIERLRVYVMDVIDDTSVTGDLSDDDIETEPVDPKDVLTKIFLFECAQYEKDKVERFHLAEQYVMNLRKDKSIGSEADKLKCNLCGFAAKSKGGLTNHSKKCKKK